jgi:rod shape-determining protein MreC
LKRQNWVIIGLLVLGWIIFLGQSRPGGTVSTKLRMIFVQLSTPFVKLGDLIPVVRSRRDLAKQNGALRGENDALRQQVQSLAEAGRRNIELEHLLNLKERVPLKTIGARVIGRDSSNWWKSIQIDRGSEDGIRVNMPVVNADGLIGKTISVTKGEARVLVLTDPNCKASALLQDSREPGVVSGPEDAFGHESRLLMTFVDRNARIKAGEAVITSGLGGIFPKGIHIGSVTRVRLNPQTGMYQDVEVKPAVDFHKLEEVLVIVE